jgi:hypothetical protein
MKIQQKMEHQIVREDLISCFAGRKISQVYMCGLSELQSRWGPFQLRTTHSLES